jgi:hypothetical protein
MMKQEDTAGRTTLEVEGQRCWKDNGKDNGAMDNGAMHLEGRSPA